MASKARKRRKRAATQPALVVGKRRGKFTHAALARSVNVSVARSLKGGARLDAKLNGVRLIFGGDDKAHAVAGAGQNNTLTWVVIGPHGSCYTIEVTDPQGAGCEGGCTLDADGRDSGSCDFST